jgi:hypothetical protein
MLRSAGAAPPPCLDQQYGTCWTCQVFGYGGGKDTESGSVGARSAVGPAYGFRIQATGRPVAILQLDKDASAAVRQQFGRSPVSLSSVGPEPRPRTASVRPELQLSANRCRPGRTRATTSVRIIRAVLVLSDECRSRRHAAIIGVASDETPSPAPGVTRTQVRTGFRTLTSQ